MKKNEAINFNKQYGHSICLDAELNLVKLIDCITEPSVYFLIQYLDGSKKELPSTETLIGLKGRLKGRDYDTIESKFHKLLQTS